MIISKKRLGYFSLVLLLLATLLQLAHAASKIALVVGNDNYENVVSLKKAVNDATTIA